VDTLNEVRTHADTLVSVGGGPAGFLGLPSGKSEFGLGYRDHDRQRRQRAHGVGAVLAVRDLRLAIHEAERSLTVSSFEEAGHVSTTARMLRNDNHC